MVHVQKFKLGEPSPNSLHAVISNVPTLDDVCSYEEQKPHAISAIRQGYPRFVRHYLIKDCTKAVLDCLELKVSYAVLVSYMDPELRNLIEELIGEPELIHFIILDSNVFGKNLELIYLDKNISSSKLLAFKLFFQHTGYEISSRHAEKILNRINLNEPVGKNENEEELLTEKISVERTLSKIANSKINGEFITVSSGMNAFFSAFKASQEIQFKKGRTKWIQLGWLYVDSGQILKKYLKKEESLSVLYNTLDVDAILREIKSAGNRLSVLVLECPTNPFCKIADLKIISDAVHAEGGLIIIDPSIVSIYNIDCLPYADILVNSLTKYAGHNGDLMAGLIALNSSSKAYKELKDKVQIYNAPLRIDDMLHLKKSLLGAESSVRLMNRNCKALSKYLNQHPKVKAVYTTWGSMNSKAYLKNPNACGAILSIEIDGSMETFYNYLQTVKGPSFGVNFTVVCPYFYLAHYDLVKDNTPSSLLNKLGINRDLIRISVGCEEESALIDTFSNALEAV